MPQVATLLGVSEGWTWRLVLDGRIPSLKIGDRRLVRRADLEAFVMRRALESGALDDVPDDES